MIGKITESILVVVAFIEAFNRLCDALATARRNFEKAKSLIK